MMRVEGKRSRGRLVWPVLLVLAFVWGIGCGARDPRLGANQEFFQGLRPASEDTARLLYNARYFKLMGQPELALKELEEAHRRDPGNIKLANALAQFYDELGMGARAQQIYLDTLALEQDNPVLNNNLCFSYYLGGNWRQAEACFRNTLARQPQNQAARNNLGLLLCREGRQEEARRLWQEAEGEAAAGQKMEEVLAILGPTKGPAYAQQARPLPEGQAPRAHAATPAVAAPAIGAVAARVPSGPPAQAPKMESQPTAVTAAPAAAPTKLAAAPTEKPRIPVREIPAPRTLEDRVAAVKPAPAKADPGPRAAIRLPQASGSPGQAAVKPAPPSPAAATPAPEVRRTAATPIPEMNKMAAAPSAPAQRSEPAKVATEVPQKPAPPVRTAPLTTRELVETNIAILNGNGTQNLAHETRSRLSREGFTVADINNYRDFGVSRTVIYYRPDSERVATVLNKKFFPGAEVEAVPQLAGNIDVKVILGRDLFPQAHAEAMAADKKNPL
ncbi:MAG: LytR C-terminal domain-containing protein [Syntrophobacterales bacterium]|nr:LytR C-terminal domain-containing protein [Syntrophobacterales bacterium]